MKTVCTPSRASVSLPWVSSRAIADMRGSVDAEGLNPWADADERFHRSLFELCGNPPDRRGGDRLLGSHSKGPSRSPASDLIAAGDAEAAVRCHLSQRLRSV